MLYHQNIGNLDKKNQQRNSRIEGHYRSNGPDRHLQSIPFYNRTIYILLSSSGTLFKIDYILGHKQVLKNIRILK
jgi:hypothetical protein